MSVAVPRWRACALSAAVCVAAAVAAHAAGAPDEPAVPAAYAERLVASLPAYRPLRQVAGTVRLWGHGSPKHDFLGPLVRRWARLFHRYQPHVRIVNRMYGTASAIGALYTGAGNLAILGEEISPAARRAFERERGYPPTRIEIATGSLETNYFDYAHMVFVNRVNPLRRLTVAQLAGIFGDAPSRGAPAIRTWGALGLKGAWSARRIHPYFWKVNQDFALFFRHRVLGGGHRWNPDIREFVTFTRPAGSVDDRGRQILQALARDPAGIAVSNIRFADARVKALRLAWSASGPSLGATQRTLITQSYPLTRIIPAFIDHAPGRPLDPAVAEFLRFILSRQGQQALIAQSGYLPLGRRQIRAQLRRIGRMSVRSGRRPRRRGARTGPETSARVASRDTLRVWGNPLLAAQARGWARGFEAIHRRARVELHMSGSDTAMAGLYTGRADVALMGRAATDSEIKAFEWVFRHAPARVPILLGSRATMGKSPALAVLVRNDNPLRRIDFAQLQGLLDAHPPPGVGRVRTWGQLGSEGPLAAHRIDVYMADSDSGTGRFFRDTVLGGTGLLEWSHVFELGARGGHARILRALSRDPFGLAITALPRNGSPVRALALARSPSGPYRRPTVRSLREDRYPLERTVYAYFNSKAIGAEAGRFIRFILSSRGQARIPAGGYLGLPAPALRAAAARAHQ